MSDSVTLIEVGPRDGLQNEKVPIPTSAKRDFIVALAGAGLREIEVTSFVSPKWVPQLADADELIASLPSGPTYSALVPNERGLDRFLDSGLARAALFTAASEAFTQKNINMTIAESLEVFGRVVERLRSERPAAFIRAYVSTAFECPFAGRIEPQAVVSVVESLLELGVDEISLGDTIGAASPSEVKSLTKAVTTVCELSKMNYHFHDTRGTAIANVAAALELGVRRFDSSAGGLGGCPYAPGAGGNLATEDLVYFLEREGVTTGVDLVALSQASLPILSILGRAPASKAQVATLASSTCAPPQP